MQYIYIQNKTSNKTKGNQGPQNCPITRELKGTTNKQKYILKLN